MRLGEEIAALDAAGIHAFHWDIMDGHFVPNLSFGAHSVKAARLKTKTFFDVHLMVEQPQHWIDSFAHAGADAITFHIDATRNPAALIAQVKSHDIKAGIAFNPDTELHMGSDIVGQIDRILIMTVNPGFGGQSFIDMSDKIKAAAAIRQAHPHLDIVVDGGIDDKTAPITLSSGATTLVSGSYLFKQKANFSAAISELKGGQA